MSSPQLACPCCGCLTLPSHGTYDICPVCFWEDDFTVDPEDDLNPNNMSLFDARANLAAWGAVDPELVHWTRPPRPDEVLELVQRVAEPAEGAAALERPLQEVGGPAVADR